MFTTILIDLDDTLFDFKKAEAKALCCTLEKLGIKPTQAITERYSEINDCMWKRLEKGEMTREEVKSKRFEVLFKELKVHTDCKLARNIYETTLSRDHIFIEGAENLLKTLYGKYRLYLVSNGSTHIQKGRIASSGIEKYFDRIFISEDVGSNKPSKEYFDYCFEKIDNFCKEETIILGDSLTSDMKGGNNAGISTCWFNPNGHENEQQIKVDYEIHSLSEFMKIL